MNYKCLLSQSQSPILCQRGIHPKDGSNHLYPVVMCGNPPTKNRTEKSEKTYEQSETITHFYLFFFGCYYSEESLFCLLVPFWRFLDHDEPTPMAPLSAWPRSPDLPPAWSVPPVVHGGWIVRAPSIRTIRPSACRCNSAMCGVVKTCENPKESLWKADGKLWKIQMIEVIEVMI